MENLDLKVIETELVKLIHFLVENDNSVWNHQLSLAKVYRWRISMYNEKENLFPTPELSVEEINSINEFINAVEESIIDLQLTDLITSPLNVIEENSDRTLVNGIEIISSILNETERS